MIVASEVQPEAVPNPERLPDRRVDAPSLDFPSVQEVRDRDAPSGSSAEEWMGGVLAGVTPERIG